MYVLVVEIEACYIYRRVSEVHLCKLTVIHISAQRDLK